MGIHTTGTQTTSPKIPQAELPTEKSAGAVWVLFGGSFNPVHVGHVAAVHGLLALEGVARVLVIPARRSPFKPQTPYLPATLRWRMLQAAFADSPGVSLWAGELRRKRLSYTDQTILCIQRQRPQLALRLAMGADAFQHFSSWRNAERILQHAQLLVFTRKSLPGASTPPPPLPQALTQSAMPLRSNAQPGSVCFVALDAPAVSSSTILRTRSLREVPAAARPFLRDYWQAHAGAPTQKQAPLHRAQR